MASRLPAINLARTIAPFAGTMIPLPLSRASRAPLDVLVGYPDRVRMSYEGRIDSALVLRQSIGQRIWCPPQTRVVIGAPDPGVDGPVNIGVSTPVLGLRAPADSEALGAAIDTVARLRAATSPDDEARVVAMALAPMFDCFVLYTGTTHMERPRWFVTDIVASQWARLCAYFELRWRAVNYDDSTAGARLQLAAELHTPYGDFDPRVGFPGDLAPGQRARSPGRIYEANFLGGLSTFPVNGRLRQ